MSSIIPSLSALIQDSNFYISGKVTVHPNAVIAPGVLLQADPDSHLIIADGVCIGVGCVLHAYQGTLVVESGVTLGSGTLVAGQGKIGANACIGAMTTIIDSSVAASEMVPPGSLIGDRSRQVVIVEASEPYPSSTPASEAERSAHSSEKEPPASTTPEPKSPEPKSPESSREATQSATETSAAETTDSSMSERKVQVVYGRNYIERMIVTMFPHRSPLESPESPPPATSEET